MRRLREWLFLLWPVIVLVACVVALVWHFRRLSTAPCEDFAGEPLGNVPVRCYKFYGIHGEQ